MWCFRINININAECLNECKTFGGTADVFHSDGARLQGQMSTSPRGLQSEPKHSKHKNPDSDTDANFAAAEFLLDNDAAKR